MDIQFPAKEGYVQIRGYNTWYRIVGERDEPGMYPVLCLHGGPGCPHDYLEPLEALAATGRRMIFYDQLGVGNSDHPDDPSMWTVDLFLEELEIIRKALQLEHLHILGQSWGGMLAMEYSLKQPPGLVSLILADSPASMPQWIAETNRLRNDLPPEVQETLQVHEKAGTTDDPAYQEAMFVFYRRHVCRLDPFPECMNRAFEKMMQSPQVYMTMVGPSEFFITGSLKDWDIVNRLGEIRVPSLVLGGRFDEATPTITKTVHQGIPGSEWVIFEESSHSPHIEESERYMQVLANFLDRVELKIALDKGAPSSRTNL
jgi:proline-specific peptidase